MALALMVAAALWGAAHLAARAASACATCEGRGYVYAPCEKCRGAGQCLACGGTGKRAAGLAGGSASMCLICKGTGLCKHCGGLGVDKTRRLPCPDCGGQAAAPERQPGRDPVNGAPSLAGAKTVPCTVCQGTGRLPGTCLLCRGTGQCRICGGTGKRAPLMKGGDEAMCVACRGTGNCRECGGSGTSKEARECAVCGGTGRMVWEPEKVLLAATKPGPGADVPESTGDLPVERDPRPPKPVRRPPSAGGDGIDEYLRAIGKLDRQYGDGRSQEIGLAEAWTGRTSGVGTLYRSTVYLLQAHVRGVRVAGSRQDVKGGGILLMPRSHGVAAKAEKVFKNVGECGKVVVTYGVVNEDNLTLFDIEPAGEAGEANGQPI